MKIDEVKDAIQKATDAVRKYKREKKRPLQKPDAPFERLIRLLDEMQEGEISKEVKELIKESFEMGQAGEICPTCGGTGRI